MGRIYILIYKGIHTLKSEGEWGFYGCSSNYYFPFLLPEHPDNENQAKDTPLIEKKGNSHILEAFKVM